MKHCIVAAFFVLMVMVAAGIAGDADPWNGTWKLNPEKSKAPGGRIPHPTSINIIKVEGDTMTMVADHTDTAGNTEHVEYTATLDGKEYPVNTTPAGAGTYTISLKKIDDRTREFVEVIGTFTIQGRDILSEDGKTFSRIVGAKGLQDDEAGILQFFEKQ